MDRVKYTLVGIAPQSVQESLQKLKRYFSLPTDTTNIQNHHILKDTAHFAIKRTFYLLPETDEENIIEKVKTITLDQKIRISCTTTGMFEGSIYGDILYIRINPDQQLQNLHMQVKSKLNNFTETKNQDMEGENYIPHLSMVYNIPKKITPEITTYIEEIILPLEFEVEELLLLKDYDTTKDERELLYKHNYLTTN